MTARTIDGRTTVAFAVTATVVVSFPVFLLGALIVQVRRDIEVPPWGLGLMVALFWVAASLISTRAGDLSDRLGPRNLTAASIATAAISLLGFALATPSWPWFVGWAVVGGLANGVQHPATNAQIAARVAEGRRGLAFGLKQAAVPAATLLAGLAIPAVALTLGWRWAFAGAALVSAVAFVVYLIVVPAGSAGIRRGRGSIPPLPPEQRRMFRLLAIMALAAGASVTASTAYLVTTAADRGVSAGLAGLLLSSASVVGVVSRIGLGFAVDRLREHGLLLSSGAVLIGGLGAARVAIPSIPTLLGGALLASGVSGAWAGLFHYFVARTAGPATPRATALTQTGSYVGCAVGPVLMGVVYGIEPHVAPWIVLAVLATAGGLLGLVVARRPIRARMPAVPGAEVATALE